MQEIGKIQIKTLITLGIIGSKYLSIDSTPIIAWVKQNNPKMFVEGKFDKTKFPQGDPEARLGFMAIKRQSRHSKERQLELFNISSGKDKTTKEIILFWGYRNHVIFDALSELPVFEKTFPANVSDCTVTVPAFKELKAYFKLKGLKGVLGDAAHDSVSIRKYIRRSLKAKDFIPQD